jgi:CheY-like chemotaxis protein/anti-sigma regulatory factor (Ser/Thr protein kinase)
MDSTRTPDLQEEPKRILIVDDDPDIHVLLTKALARPGRYFESAFNGDEGLEKFQSANWDVVITDVIMPLMNGMELLEHIRKLRPEARVVVMTVDSTAEKIVSAIRENAFAWFRKPFTISAVREMVDGALESPRRQDDIQVLSAGARWLQLRLRCDPEIGARALQFVREMEPDLPDSERESVAAAFREILTNAMEHGGGNNPEVRVTVTFIRADGALLFHVRDPGPGFSFEKLRHAAISNPPDSPADHVMERMEHGMRPGGYGILMSRLMVDELLYNEKGNEAMLIKYLRRPAQE